VEKFPEVSDLTGCILCGYDDLKTEAVGTGTVDGHFVLHSWEALTVDCG
jgi:hypothetical protein